LFFSTDPGKLKVVLGREMIPRGMLLIGMVVLLLARGEFATPFAAAELPVRRPLQLRGAGACLPLTAPWREAAEGGGGDQINGQLLRAAALGHEHVVKKLVESGADVNCSNAQMQTPMMIAAEKGRLGVLQRLLECGALREETDEKGSNALHYASYNGHLDAMKLLVEAGVDVNARNRFGYSPLQYACAEGSIGSVELLLSLGADVHSHDKMGWTSLHRAAGNGHAGVVRMLIKNGADVNGEDLQNYTALHEATWCGHEEIAGILLTAGARIEKTDQWGNSALDLAFSRVCSSSPPHLLARARIRGNVHLDTPRLDWQARDGKSDLYDLLRSFDARQGSRGDERGDERALGPARGQTGSCEQGAPFLQAPVQESGEVWRRGGAGEGKEESPQGPLLETDGGEMHSRAEARASSSSLNATTSPLNFIL